MCGQSAFRVRPIVNGGVRFRSAARGRGGAFQALLDCVSYRPRCVSGPAPPESHKSEAPEATRYKPCQAAFRFIGFIVFIGSRTYRV